MVAYVKGARARSKLVNVNAGTFAKPKAVAMDYRSNSTDFGGAGNIFGAAALATHKKYMWSVLNMQPSQAQVGQVGYLFVQSLVTDNPLREVYEYTICSQFYGPTEGGLTYQPITDLLVAGDTNGRSYYAINAANGEKTKSETVKTFPAYEINPCLAFTLANGAGKKAPQIISEGYDGVKLNPLFAVGLKGPFMDNFWVNPGGFTFNGGTTFSYPSNSLVTRPDHLDGFFCVGDYDYSGTNDLRQNGKSNWTTTLNQEWRKGLALYNDTYKANHVGCKTMGNADGDFTSSTEPDFGTSALASAELTGKVNIGHIEGLLSNSGNDTACIGAFRGSLASTLSRVYTMHDNAIDGALINNYLMSSTDNLGRTQQKCRATVALALVADCMFACSDRLTGSANMRPYDNCDEIFVQIGDVIAGRPAGATHDGMIARFRSNGGSVFNPSSNKGRWLGNSGASIARSGNIVTLIHPLMAAHGKVAGDKIRIQDCTSDGGSFNGIFTILDVPNSTTIRWNQVGSNVSAITNALGYYGMLSRIDLTGLGYKAILGTVDAHSLASYLGTYNGTSQNDGRVLTTVDIWPNDGFVFIK